MAPVVVSGCGSDYLFKVEKIIPRGGAGVFRQEVVSEAFAQGFGNIDRGNEFLADEFLELSKAVMKMPIAPTRVAADEFCVIIEEVAFELMAGDEPGTDGLLLKLQFRFLRLDEDESFLVVVFLQLIFRVGVFEDTGGNAAAGLTTRDDVEEDLVAFTVDALFNIHSDGFI